MAKTPRWVPDRPRHETFWPIDPLRGAGRPKVAVPPGEDALKRLETTIFDVVLLDLNLPGMHGMNVLSAAPATQTDAQFIVMTAFGSVDTAVEAMKLGAFDYVNKPFRTEELLLTLRRALEETELRREVAHLRARSSDGIRNRIIGRTSAMQRVFDLIERVAPTRATVLVVRETGTGKELVARAIHDVSDRARKPFVPVNCSALTETLRDPRGRHRGRAGGLSSGGRHQRGLGGKGERRSLPRGPLLSAERVPDPSSTSP